MIAAARYGELVALLKTRLGGLYPLEFYKRLVASPNEADLGHQLQAAGVPMPSDGKLPTKRWLLGHWLIPDYRSALTRVTKTARDVVCGWLTRLELENVKFAIRALARGQRVRPDRLVDLGELGSLRQETLAEVQHLDSLISATRGTVFEEPLRTTVQTIHGEDGLFLSETALDRAVYSHLATTARRYRGSGALPLRRMTNRFVNRLTLLWIARYRLGYGLPEEAASGLVLTSTSRRLIDLARQTAQAASIEDVGRIWSTSFMGALRGVLTKPPSTLIEWERRCWQDVLYTAKAMVLGQPFGLSVIIGLLLLKELTIHDLAVICQGQANGLVSADLEALLIHE